MRSATEYLIATQQAERALKAGNCGHPFDCGTSAASRSRRKTLLGHGPLLLTFYTGSWCPACSRDLQAFDSLRPSVEARGASLVSISQQTAAENAKARARLKLGFPILSDRRGRIAQLFGVRWCIPELLRDIHRKSGIDLPLLNGGVDIGISFAGFRVLSGGGEKELVVSTARASQPEPVEAQYAL
jgi:peroxiredoxin